MTNFKPKEYAIEIYPDIDSKSSFYAGFRYDALFFKDIMDLIKANDLNHMLQFPVDNSFFEIYSYHKWTDDFKILFLKSNGFASIEKIRKIKPEEYVSSIRLYVFQKTFHFGIMSVNGMNFHTNDFDLDFLSNLKEHYKNRNSVEQEVTV